MLMRLAHIAPKIIGSQQKQHFLHNVYKQDFNALRNYARAPPTGDRVVRRSATIKERLMAPPSENAYSVGKGAAAGAAVMGIGALCYYGISTAPNSIASTSMLWPQYVRDRIHTTYGYFAASLGITAASAAAIFSSPRLLNFVARDSKLAIIASIAVVLASGYVTHAIPYQEGIGGKQLAWAIHCAIMGGMLAPMCFLGGPLLTRAALYTAGIAGGLSTVAACSPSEKFLYMGGPLAIGLGFVFASSLASMWLPPTTALGAGLASMSVYGGLILFSAFLLYDTQRIVRHAETYPLNSYQPFDPINSSLKIYIDVLNIFIRMAMILSSGNSNKKR